jgi:hypothetical protein
VDGSSARSKSPQIALMFYGVLIIVFVTSSPQGIVGWLKQLRFRVSRWATGNRRRLDAIEDVQS